MHKKALILDGNANFLYGLQTRFVVSGMDVLTHDGTGYVEDILQILRLKPIDFIIADLELPDLDGFETISRIKSESEFTRIPYFIYTFINDEMKKKRSLNLGADYYFLKEEIGLDDFSQKVRKIMINQDKMNVINRSY